MKFYLTTCALFCLCGFAVAQDQPPAEETIYPAFKVPEASGVVLPQPRKFDITPATVETAKPVGLAVVIKKHPPAKAAPVEPVKLMKPFKVKLLTRWSPVWGYDMKQMLDRIEAAEKAGDTKTYDELTKTFTTWADSYLVEPDTRQKP